MAVLDVLRRILNAAGHPIKSLGAGVAPTDAARLADIPIVKIGSGTIVVPPGGFASAGPFVLPSADHTAGLLVQFAGFANQWSIGALPAAVAGSQGYFTRGMGPLTEVFVNFFNSQGAAMTMKFVVIASRDPAAP